MSQSLDDLEADLADVILKHGLDKQIEVPAHILAEQIVTQLAALKTAWGKLRKHKLNTYICN